MEMISILASVLVLSSASSIHFGNLYNIWYGFFKILNEYITCITKLLEVYKAPICVHMHLDLSVYLEIQNAIMSLNNPTLHLSFVVACNSLRETLGEKIAMIILEYKRSHIGKTLHEIITLWKWKILFWLFLYASFTEIRGWGLELWWFELFESSGYYYSSNFLHNFISKFLLLHAFYFCFFTCVFCSC